MQSIARIDAGFLNLQISQLDQPWSMLGSWLLPKNRHLTLNGAKGPRCFP